MSTITFDTLHATHLLREAGFDEKQAESIVHVLFDAQARLVTRDYFDLKMEFLGKDLQAQELRMTMKLGAMLVAAVGILVALLKLPH